MFPKFTSSDEQPFNLRRPYSTRRGNGLGAHFDMPQTAYDCLDGNLDLSIHHPSTPFGNRFAPLARPEATVHRDREFYTSRPHRRSRNSRGTKEAKKRRDSRRNKRKFAVHLLNEQLSRNIEETLTQYDIHPTPPVNLTTTTSTAPSTSVSQHVYGNGTTHAAPAAPQLPPITFHGFNLPDFPPLVIPRISPPPSPRPMLAGVPAWCPPIPSLTSAGGSSSALPKFYDLSCLQEPQCQEVQLWQKSPTRMPKKQSRFFPPRPTSPKPTVRLPPTGPKCSFTGAGIHDPSDVAWKCESATAKPDSITEAIEKIVAAAMATDAIGRTSQLPSAANLWNILAQSQREPTEHENQHELSGTGEETDVPDLPIPVFNGQLGPFELSGGDVPYVHTNSLTGYANETAARHFDSTVLGDSAIYLAEMFSSSNNPAPAYELYGTLPLQVHRSSSRELLASDYPTTPPHALCDMNPPEVGHTSRPEFLLSGHSTAVSHAKYHELDDAIDTPAESTGEELENSAAHFKSEQELFALPSSSEHPNQSPSASYCDLATFLSMGHAEKCWCLACDEEPELVSGETVTEPEDSFTEDDGWMLWSTDCDTESTNVAEMDAAASDAQVEQDSAALRQGKCPSTWDDFFPRKPRRARALIKSESDAQFLGYYDDSAAFAYANEDEWEWNF